MDVRKIPFAVLSSEELGSYISFLNCVRLNIFRGSMSREADIWDVDLITTRGRISVLRVLVLRSLAGMVTVINGCNVSCRMALTPLEEASRIVFVGNSGIWVLFDTVCCFVILLAKTVVASFSFCRRDTGTFVVTKMIYIYIFQRVSVVFSPCNVWNFIINCHSNTY